MFNVLYFSYGYLKERGKRREKKQNKQKQNKVQTNEAASPGVRFWKKTMKLESRLNSQRGAK